MKRLSSYILVVVIFFSILNCAKRGTPTGGEKDTTPPQMVKADPPMFTTNYDNQRIRIYFDEYIKLSELQKQLIVSPPIDQGGYVIRPQGTASKYVEINIKDTLQENTTYTFNFGRSIQDNNEGNPYEYFTYVFSTGNYIDSLEVTGVVKDAIKKFPDQFVSVMLYEKNEQYGDSTIYKEKPTYITNTLDSAVSFRLANLRAGKYKMIALKDVGNNYTFDPATDKIAFVKEDIVVPTDSIYELTLFKEIENFSIGRPGMISRNRIAFAYTGLPDSMEIKLLSSKPEGFKEKITKEKDKDSLNYWFTPIDLDSLQFEVSKGTEKETFTVRKRKLPKDSLTLKPNIRGSIVPGKRFAILSNIPLEAKDESLMSLIDKDSMPVPFTTMIKEEDGELQLEFDFETAPSQRYRLALLPNAIKDFYGDTNDSLDFTLSTKSLADYGNIRVTLQNVKQYPIILQVTVEKGEVVKEIYATASQPEYSFESLEPGKYYIRLIYDENKNGQWDTGNFLEKRQPEKVYYLPGDLKPLRANWDINETFILPEE
ncbi:Ig-like domain-containing protein [Sungkyunkwania multivorans]|uniref:Ig-like domain-containing protein n=1 Tax=Sungkyunkwania multivorans TaxID=1173618 RepID=A0ABW3D005_9FLAO